MFDQVALGVELDPRRMADRAREVLRRASFARQSIGGLAQVRRHGLAVAQGRSPASHVLGGEAQQYREGPGHSQPSQRQSLWCMCLAATNRPQPWQLTLWS